MRPARDSWRYRLTRRGAGLVGASLLRLLGSSWRLRLSGADPFRAGRPFVAVAWHQGVLVAAFVWRDRRLAVPVSRSRDGDLMDAALRHLGFAESPRGSSSRGATTLLRSLIRRARRGEQIAVLPDGPRGPARQVKPGVIALARTTGLPLVPVGIAARPALRFASWDAALCPLPFARVLCRYGEPLLVPMDARGDSLEAWCQKLADRLDRLNLEVEDALAEGRRPRIP